MISVGSLINHNNSIYKVTGVGDGYYEANQVGSMVTISIPKDSCREVLREGVIEKSKNKGKLNG